MNGPRKPIQIAVIPPFHPYEQPTVYALCDDGSIWSRLDLDGQLWYQMDNFIRLTKFQRTMTNQQHPITPPQELVDQWNHEWHHSKISDTVDLDNHLTTQAARWGADQELKGCYEWVVRNWTDIQSADMLLAARRPKPPSLKEQALEALEQIDGHAIRQMSAYVIYDELKTYADTIRRALEQLDD